MEWIDIDFEQSMSAFISVLSQAKVYCTVHTTKANPGICLFSAFTFSSTILLFLNKL